MKKINQIISMLFLCFFFSNSYAQKPSNMFYATMETKAALELLKDHPEDIKIVQSNNGYSAVMLTDDAAHELHHKVLVHGPGFLYASSEKKAISDIQQRRLSQKLVGGFSITQDQLVRQSLDLVNNLNIANQIQELAAYGTRYHTTSIARQAVLDLQTRWENLANGRSDVSIRIVNHTSTNMPSLIMTITGTEEPDEFVILGGHMDSTASGSNNDAPGADDNASGISTITEAARVLFEMNYKPKRTIEFMAFAAEEVGLRGSREIAEDYRNNNVDVVSYMQLDMTNYKGSTNDVYISTDSYNDDTLNDFMIELMNYYNASGTHKITYGTSQCNYGCSDHYSWAQEGYDVTFPFEAAFTQSNPNIHTNQDTFDKFPTPNATHAAKFAKLALEYLIEISNGVNNNGEESCNLSIPNFPYSESFEGSLGTWIQSSNDDIDWTVDANGTPSNGTGPDAAINGSSYIYVEASGNGIGFPNKQAILTSPCFDLTNIINPTFSFAYHMEGNAIGSLLVEVSTDDGTSWVPIFNKSGSIASDWSIENIDLGNFIDTDIQIRFNAVTGTSWQGDIAIDAITIGTSNPNPNPDVCESLDFNEYNITSFSNQDDDGDFSVVSGGSGLLLQNNTWKSISLDYTVTSSTVLEFDFSSNSQGEIHGIGFENDNELTANRYFKLYGTQNYGITNYDNYSGGTSSYIIPVGDFYNGTMNRLVFINDNDTDSGNTSIFSNVKIYEESCIKSATAPVAFGTNTPVLGDQDELDIAIKITPNPTKDSFVLAVQGNKKAYMVATIFSILGKKMSEVELQSGNNDISTRNLSLQSGIYLIKVTADGEELDIQKLVIQ